MSNGKSLVLEAFMNEASILWNNRCGEFSIFEILKFFYNFQIFESLKKKIPGFECLKNS